MQSYMYIPGADPGFSFTRGGGGKGVLTEILKKISAVVFKIWIVQRARRKIDIVDDMSPIIN